MDGKTGKKGKSLNDVVDELWEMMDRVDEALKDPKGDINELLDDLLFGEEAQDAERNNVD